MVEKRLRLLLLVQVETKEDSNETQRQEDTIYQYEEVCDEGLVEVEDEHDDLVEVEYEVEELGKFFDELGKFFDEQSN